LNEFGEQDPFATNKAREAFNTSTSDPFGGAFSTTSNVSSSLIFFLKLMFSPIWIFYLKYNY